MKRLLSLMVVMIIAVTALTAVSVSAATAVRTEKGYKVFYEDFQSYNSLDELKAAGYETWNSANKINELGFAVFDDGNKAAKLTYKISDSFSATAESAGSLKEIPRLLGTVTPNVLLQYGKVYTFAISGMTSQKDAEGNISYATSGPDRFAMNVTPSGQRWDYDASGNSDDATIGQKFVTRFGYTSGESYTFSDVVFNKGVDETFTGFITRHNATGRNALNGLWTANGSPANKDAEGFGSFKSAVDALEFTQYYDNVMLTTTVNYYNVNVTMNGGTATVTTPDSINKNTVTGNGTLEIDDLNDTKFVITPADGYVVKSVTYAGNAIEVVDGSEVIVSDAWENLATGTLDLEVLLESTAPKAPSIAVVTNLIDNDGFTYTNNNNETVTEEGKSIYCYCKIDNYTSDVTAYGVKFTVGSNFLNLPGVNITGDGSFGIRMFGDEIDNLTDGDYTVEGYIE